MKRRSLYLAIISAFLVGLLVVYRMAISEAERTRGANVHEVPFLLGGKPAPAFTLHRIDTGEPVTLEQLKGKPVVLNFWATWCGPCTVEHPVLQWGAKNYGDQAVFLGVVFEDSKENATRYLAQHGSIFPQLLDQKGAMAVDYGVSGVPETYFIDRSGVILGKYAMPIDPRTLSQRLNELLASPGPQTGQR